MEIIAHRGASYDAPENSLEAFEIAIEQGATRVELDIQLTRDGVPVVNHDDNTERTGDRNVEIQFTSAEELRSVKLANGEPIPTLEEVCQALSGRCSLDVELKATRPGVAEGILETMEKHDLLSDALLTSFDPVVLRLVRKLGYTGRSGLVVGSTSLLPRQRFYETWPMHVWREAQATDLVMHHRLIHPPLTYTVRKEQGSVILWMSMDDEARPPEKRAAWYQRIERMQPDGVILARVEEALRHINPTSAPPSTESDEPVADDVSS
jgi:glycerophosphoryl diester phosphodiesterase